MDVENNDMWVLLLSCVRYSMGRKTYMSSLAPELVEKYSEALTKLQLEQIYDELEKELGIEEDCPGQLGLSCDVESWKKFHKWLRREINNRDEE